MLSGGGRIGIDDDRNWWHGRNSTDLTGMGSAAHHLVGRETPPLVGMEEPPVGMAEVVLLWVSYGRRRRSGLGGDDE